MKRAEPLDEPLEPISPDDIDDIAAIKLFKAVVLQAFKDACSNIPEPYPPDMPEGYVPHKSKKPPKEAYAKLYKARLADIDAAEQRQREARSWLLGNTPDFRRVCRFAEWEPDYIASKARQLMKRGWSMPPSTSEKITEVVFN